jgi:RES domain-containing protein
VKLYRIGTKDYPVFDATGAAMRGGRWNSVNVPVIYCGLNVSVARLEIMGYIPIGPNHKLVVVDVPSVVKIIDLNPTLLPAGWSGRDHSATRKIGDDWVASQKSALLKVPSVASPLDFNVVINPAHPDFQVLLALDPVDLVWPIV